MNNNSCLLINALTSDIIMEKAHVMEDLAEFQGINIPFSDLMI